MIRTLPSGSPRTETLSSRAAAYKRERNRLRLLGVFYADFFGAALALAQRARCAAAIFLRAAADIVFLLGMLITFCFCPSFARTLAHRALCAAAILALADADKRLRVLVLPSEAPFKAARAASSRSTVLAA